MNNSGTAQGLASSYSGQAQNNSNILTPTLNRMATNPQGFSQQTMNNMNTAAQQSVGGAASGIVGQGNQEAARTNNAGGYQAMASQAGHDATAQLSDAALNVQNRNAQLQEQQRQEGLSGLQSMYGTNVGAGENALGLSNQSLGVAQQANQQAFNQWFQPFNSIIGGATGVGRAALGQ